MLQKAVAGLLQHPADADFRQCPGLPIIEAMTGNEALSQQDSEVGATGAGQRLRLLSYNIQTGTTTSKFRDYITQSWRHVLPSAQRMENLNRIADMLADYDLVGLQEVDAGSLRSGFINQTEYIAARAGFPYWFHQTNRRIGKIAQHSNGVLSRYRPSSVSDHKLPGTIPGRGALIVRFGGEQHSLIVVIMHLALGKRTRMRQLHYISRVVAEYDNVVIMGDMNCAPDSDEMNVLLRGANLREPAPNLYTFPSWQPDRHIDHILVSPSIEVEKVNVLSHTWSDHLPIAMSIRLPEAVVLETGVPETRSAP